MMEVAGPWTEVFEGSDRNGSPEEESFLTGSTLTLAPLVSESASVRRSQPIFITANRIRGIETFSSSVPSIPNPFPELCSPSKSPVISSLPPTTNNKHLIKVFGEDRHSRSVWVSPEATAREVCHMLVQTAHCSDEENWALLEVHPALGLERCLEDHEIVWEVQTTWSLKADTRLVFRKNYAKYEFFRKPTLFFPESMISDSADVGKDLTSAELIQNLLKSGTCPEIQGYLHSKESSRKSWKKVYYFLRRSGLYCSTKGSSKPSKNPVRAQDLKFLCAENEQTRTCWTSSFRLFKHGKQLQCNYQLSKLAPRNLEAANHFTDTKSRSEASLVAMDFSGKAGGRVIQNPSEIRSAEKEEGQAWRRREALRCSLPNLNSGPRPSSIHKTQPWFHGGVSRNEAQRLIERQGLVDGMFLVRDSQQHTQCFVLSLCYKLKTKHYLVIPCEEGGRKYYTMDDGLTLFIDLLQLVEFHQINRGILPVCLKHPCVCVL
uniref:Growth factor receptor bound protein 7 n=1 Tax=Neogobius melanostomus TaxID=47308 RepID=A0A8C6WIE9_9GOBI